MAELTKEHIARLRELHGRFKVFTMMHEDWNDAVGALPALLDAAEQRDRMREENALQQKSIQQNFEQDIKDQAQAATMRAVLFDAFTYGDKKETPRHAQHCKKEHPSGDGCSCFAASAIAAMSGDAGKELWLKMLDLEANEEDATDLQADAAAMREVIVKNILFDYGDLDEDGDACHGCMDCGVVAKDGKPVSHKDFCETAKALSGDAGKELLEWAKGVAATASKDVWIIGKPPEWLKANQRKGG